MKDKLDWKNLRNFECPKCGETLKKSDSMMGYECTDGDFFITEEKFRSLTAGFYAIPKSDGIQIGEEEFLS